MSRFFAVLFSILYASVAVAQAPLNPANPPPTYVAPGTPGSLPLAGVTLTAPVLTTPSITAPVTTGHPSVTGVPAPIGTNCTIDAGSTDHAGSCAATATSAVAVAFSTAWTALPVCVVLDRTTASGNLLTAFTTAGFTMGTTVSGDKINWICIGHSGG